MTSFQFVAPAKAEQTVTANFTNGHLEESRASDVNFGLFTRAKGLNKQQILVSESETMDYIGSSGESGANLAQSSAKYCLGVLDKKTGKMKVYDTTMFIMKPRKEEDEEKDEETQALAFREKSDLLTEAFGSIRKKRAMQSRLNNKIEEKTLDIVIGSAVNQTSITTPSPGKKVGEPDIDVSVLPSHNFEAEKPCDVYPIRQLIDEEIMSALRTPAQVFMDLDKKKLLEWHENQTYPAYILQQLSHLPIQKDARQTHCCYLVYLHYMMHLFHLRAKDLRKKDYLPEDVPLSVKAELQRQFTLHVQDQNNRSVRCIPSRLKDRLLSYILVLCLTIEGYMMDVSLLQTGLKLGQQRMTSHLQLLGCQLKRERTVGMSSTAGSSLVATLKIPLSFPETRSPRKAKRKGK